MNKETKDKLSAAGKKSAKIQKERKEQRIKQYNLQPKLCPVCNTAIPYDKRGNTYCSRSCSATRNNKGVCRNGSPRRTLYCKNCGKELSRSQKKYCDGHCQGEFNWKKRKLKIEKEQKETSPRYQRRYLKEKYGEKCSICGLEEWRGMSPPLICDHIDGNAGNNSLTNLRLVCANCDMQLPTYKSKNKGKGRLSRKLKSRETAKRAGGWI